MLLVRFSLQIPQTLQAAQILADQSFTGQDCQNGRFIKTAASLRLPVPYTTYRDVRSLWRGKEVNETALTVQGAVI